jgi:hypothetical protein
MADTAPGGFTATVRHTATGPVIEAAGDLDLDTAPLLRTALHRALEVTPVPDMGVCDSTGLNTLSWHAAWPSTKAPRSTSPAPAPPAQDC